MTFGELKRAERRQAKIKIGLFGPSGSGKTYSALQMASGMTAWEKIAVIDTERGSADLYSDLGPYNTLTLVAPYTPERYVDAINACVEAGMEVIIIDSISHEWDGVGGCLQIHEAMPGNSYTNWAKVTPRHNRFIDAILQAPVHVICCGRTKQDYVLQEKNGKQVPEKVGLKVTTREGFDYEVTLALDLDIKHNATSSKDRTGLFADKPAFVITPDTGRTILAWANSGSAPVAEPAPIHDAEAELKRKNYKAITGLIKTFNLAVDDAATITMLPLKDKDAMALCTLDQLVDGWERLKNHTDQLAKMAYA